MTDLGTGRIPLVAWVAEYMEQVGQVNTPGSSQGLDHLSKVEEETGIHMEQFLEHHTEVEVVVVGVQGRSGAQVELLGNHTKPENLKGITHCSHKNYPEIVHNE